jgi:signal peptidase II
MGVGVKMSANIKLQALSLKKYLQLAVIAGVVVLVDQITKFIILKTLPLYYSITVIPDFFDLTHIHNTGGAFGFLSGNTSNIQRLAFLLASSAAIGLIFYFYKKTPHTHRFLLSGLALILGGAIGNLIDRIRLGRVVDFLDFYVGNLHWPAFNVADSAVSVGMIIFLFHLLFKKVFE